MKKNISISILIFFCCACTQDTRSYEDRQSDRLTNLFAKKMQPLGLRAIGIGGAMREGKVTLFSVTFLKDEVLEKNNLRKLAIITTNEFLDYLNSIEENYFFAKIPADLSMVSISIIGRAPEQGGNYLCSVSSRNGMIFYDYDNEAMQVKNLPSEKESFEDAVSILNEQNCSGNLSDKSSKNGAHKIVIPQSKRKSIKV